MSKVALITGGTRGIGLGIARCLASEGWNLILNGVRSLRDVSDVMEELRIAFQCEVQYVQGNIALEPDRDSIVRQSIDRFGKVHALINNAGVAPSARLDILETSEESYERVMGINLRGPFFLTQTFANEMIHWKEEDPQSAYAIVNIGSISSTLASVSRGEYCLSKAAMSMMTNLFAARLGEANIPVYEIRPGLIKTDMTNAVEAKYSKMISEGLTVQRRWGMPEDVGKAVAAVLRGDLPYATGQVIMVDGGLTLNRL